jgi:predicted Zn finger-like uncharacterized protein
VTVTCAACQTRYRFDESAIPVRGLKVRCSRCRDVFRLSHPGGLPPGAPDTLDHAAVESGPRLAEIERLARVVLSDLEVYHPARLDQAIESGRFFDEFHGDLEEARRIARTRFADAKDPVGLFDRALLQMCAERANSLLSAR